MNLLLQEYKRRATIGAMLRSPSSVDVRNGDQPLVPAFLPPLRPLLICLIIGLLAGGLVVSVVPALQLIHPVEVQTVSGVTTAANSTGTAIGITASSSDSAGPGFSVADTDGRECLVPLSSGQRVEFGLVRLPVDLGGARDFVPWIRCLS